MGFLARLEAGACLAAWDSSSLPSAQNRANSAQKRAYNYTESDMFFCAQQRKDRMEETRDVLSHRIPELSETMSPDEAKILIEYNGRDAARDTTWARIAQRFMGRRPKRVLDIGGGPASVGVQFALTFPETEVVSVDACPMMTGAARSLVSAMGVSDRVRPVLAKLPREKFGSRFNSFDLVFSRSVLHHFRSAPGFWRTVRKYLMPGGKFLVYDMARPATRAAAWQLVGANFAGDDCPESFRNSYFRSFLAAYRTYEVSDQLERCGLDSGTRIMKTGTSHMLIAGGVG